METNKDILLRRHIVLNNDSSECERLYKFLADSLEQLPVTLEFKHDIKLVAEELLANIINHGYAGNSAQSIDLELSVDSNSVHLTFTDSGGAFNPLERETPALLNDLSEGGMGILLVKSLTDEQHYARTGNQNVFTVTKNYNIGKT
jgi:serine/threonine-protein kinase RsbW